MFYRADSSPHCSSEPEYHFGEGFAQERGKYLHSTGHWALLQAQLPEPSLFWYILLFSSLLVAMRSNQKSDEGGMFQFLSKLHKQRLLSSRVIIHTLLSHSKASSEFVNTTLIKIY